MAPLPRPVLALLATALASLVLAPAAGARVLLVATGDANATLTDVSSGKVVARVAVPGRTRAVAVAPDGVRGYVAAGGSVAAIDLNGRAAAGTLALPGTPAALAISGDGMRLVAARRGALDVIDPATLTVIRSIALGTARKAPTALAVSADGTKGVAVLDAKRVAIADLVGG